MSREIDEKGRFVARSDWQEKFLELLKEWPIIDWCAKQCGITPHAIRNYRDAHPEYEELVQSAIREGVAELEYAVHALAKGVSLPNNKKIDKTALFFVVKKHVPEYRENYLRYTQNNKTTYNIKIDAETIEKLPPPVLQLIVDNKMSEGQLIEFLSQEKYKHLLPAPIDVEARAVSE